MNIFISSNKVMFNKSNVKDLRMKTAGNVNLINKPIDSKDSFVEYMTQFGYNSISSNTISNLIEDYEVNINLTNNSVESIICYQNSDVVSISEDLLKTVTEQINSYK